MVLLFFCLFPIQPLTSVLGTGTALPISFLFTALYVLSAFRSWIGYNTAMFIIVRLNPHLPAVNHAHIFIVQLTSLNHTRLKLW